MFLPKHPTAPLDLSSDWALYIQENFMTVKLLCSDQLLLSIHKNLAALLFVLVLKNPVFLENLFSLFVLLKMKLVLCRQGISTSRYELPLRNSKL
jgi:hypothetical protein